MTSLHDTTAIDRVLQQAVDAGDVPHVVALAADENGPIYEGAAGPQAVGSNEPISADTMFRIASMTKMVATVGALQQVERGNLDLDTPVEELLPEFADLQVLDGFEGKAPILRPPASKATVRQLITHTAGLGYWFFNEDLKRWEEATGNPNVLSGSNEAFKAPLVADPGTRFEYGINTDWLGRVVEVAAGESLDRYLHDNVLQPLGMDNTVFLMDDAQRARSTPIHVRDDDGQWVPTEVDWSQQPEWWAGGHGLYATPRDYLAFQRMLLNNGQLDGERILSAESVRAAFTNQIGDLDFPETIPTAEPQTTAAFHGGPGLKWGFGLLLNTRQAPGMRAAGSGAWAGLFNTHFWVDQASGVTGAIYTQTLPFVEPRVFAVYTDFEKALYAALS